MFKPLENNRPFAKVAFEGFAGDGKSYTAVEMAIGIHKVIGSKKPIAMFDTEKALKALKFKFDENSIEAVIHDENRSLESLRQAIEWCENGGADVLVIDSITHVWEEFLRAYMAQKNRTRLEFQDWGVIKPMWKEKFSNKFVNANVHIIFTGRAGFEYETEIIKGENGARDRKEIHKSGIKMKAEGETAFEPDVLILMEKEQDVLGDKKVINRNATILKDRTTRIDGKTFKNPTFEDFYPAIKQLLEGTIKFSLGGVEIPDTFADFDNKYSELGRRKDKAVNEIEGAMKLMGLGTGAEDQKTKAWIVKSIFGINSVENLSTLKAEELEAGLIHVNKFAGLYINYCGDVLERQAKRDPLEVVKLMKGVLEPQQPATVAVVPPVENKETSTSEATKKYNDEHGTGEPLIMSGEKKSRVRKPKVKIG